MPTPRPAIPSFRSLHPQRTIKTLRGPILAPSKPRVMFGHRNLLGLFASCAVASHFARGCNTGSSEKYLDNMWEGNQKFRETMSRDHPGFLKTLAKAQTPPFMILGCSDSRVSEQTIFDAQLGTMFTTRNIANVFTGADTTVSSALAFAVDALKSEHIVVLGHYGCGGVAAAMTEPKPPTNTGSAAIEKWILPIRNLYETSKRPEIVAYRKRPGAHPFLPDLSHDPAFRAMVEENVKASVKRIAKSIFMQETHKSHSLEKRNTGATCTASATQPVFIHGWVYDMEDGIVYDLDVSIGPQGVPLPKSSFPKVPAANSTSTA